MPGKRLDAVNCQHTVDEEIHGESCHDNENSAKTIVHLVTVQAAQQSRQQELTADELDDLWRFSCEMPDAPHLRKR